MYQARYCLHDRIINEIQAESEFIEKHGESTGIRWKWRRLFYYGNDKHSVDFNTYLTNQVKEYKNELLLNNPEQRSKEPEPAQHMLVEGHNLERMITIYSYYPTDDQICSSRIAYGSATYPGCS